MFFVPVGMPACVIRLGTVYFDCINVRVVVVADLAKGFGGAMTWVNTCYYLFLNHLSVGAGHQNLLDTVLPPVTRPSAAVVVRALVDCVCRLLVVGASRRVQERY